MDEKAQMQRAEYDVAHFRGVKEERMRRAEHDAEDMKARDRRRGTYWIEGPKYFPTFYSLDEGERPKNSGGK